MASNVADTWLYFPSTVRTTVAGVNSTAATGVLQMYSIFSRCQIKQFGVAIVVKWPTHTADPVIKLQQVNGTDYATTTDLVTLTLGPTNTNLFFPTIDPTAVASGGPGTLYTGPGLGGNKTAATSTLMAAGTIILARDSVLPTAVLNPGDLLQVNVTTQGTTAGTTGQYVAFVRLEIAGESQLENTNVAQQTN